MREVTNLQKHPKRFTKYCPSISKACGYLVSPIDFCHCFFCKRDNICVFLFAFPTGKQCSQNEQNVSFKNRSLFQRNENILPKFPPL